MATTSQMSGMRGVYLVAAELVARGFIVSVTSRSAAGADLLVTTQDVRTAWSVQVKATPKPATYWLLGPKARQLRARSHVYVFVARMAGQPEFYVVPSRVVAKHVKVKHRKRSTWYSWIKQQRYRDAWHLLRR
jgi:hypothetical protein